MEDGSINAAVAAPLLWNFMDLPESLRVHIFNFVDAEKSKLEVILVSKQWHYECNDHPAIETKIVPSFVLSPAKKEVEHNDNERDAYSNVIDRDRGDSSSLHRCFRSLEAYNQNQDIRKKLQHYRHLKVNDPHLFQKDPYYDRRLKSTTIRWDSIVSLELSSLQSKNPSNYQLAVGLSRILPNLRTLDVSNTEFSCFMCFGQIVYKCPLLEKIICNNITQYGVGNVSLWGSDMEDIQNLKEIIMDNSTFNSILFDDDVDALLNLNDDTRPKLFLFYKCCKVLERVSIRNATFGKHKMCVAQHELIKFVRSAPTTLKWFRSDLTEKNKRMLKLERPEIELS